MNTAVSEMIRLRTPPGEVSHHIASIIARSSSLESGFAHQLAGNGNAAFREITPVQVIAVPAAIEREDQLDQTFMTIQQQRATSLGPFSIIISANYPIARAEKEKRLIEANVDMIRDAERIFDDVPMSHYVTPYQSGIPIGEIREHLLNTSVVSYRNNTKAMGSSPSDILLTSWDADTRNASHDYFARLQHAYAHSQAKTWAGYPELIMHEMLDQNQFPRINVLIDWLNLGSYYGLKEIAQQHFSINVGGYARSDGYGSHANGEHTELWNTAERNGRFEENERITLTGVSAIVSARRLVHQVVQGSTLGYDSLTSTSEIPTLPESDLTDDQYASGMYSVIDHSMWQVVEGRREALIGAGMPYSQARELARQYARDLFLRHTEEIGSQSWITGVIRKIAENPYDPFAYKRFRLSHDTVV